MIDATRCPECDDVVERCCADCVRERCACGATVEWNTAEPIAKPLQRIAASGGETA